MIEMQYLVRQIPFFSGKNYSIHSDIYRNDAYPACLMVQCGTHMYKVRFPGVLNKDSVQSEKAALIVLAEHDVVGIPCIVAEGVVDGVPYLVENYIKGKSLDKIYKSLSCKDWEHIAHRLALFLQEMITIQSAQPSVFKAPENNYGNYGEVIKESILRHLKRHTSSGFISSSSAFLIQELLEDIGSVFHASATFLHFDIKPQNIVYDVQSKHVSFIDYEHSRMGDYTHELFRADMAVMRNPYFNDCWYLAKQEFCARQSSYLMKEDYSHKLFYYELLYDISEMTYSVLTGNRRQIAVHLNRIEDKLRQF